MSIYGKLKQWVTGKKEFEMADPTLKHGGPSSGQLGVSPTRQYASKKLRRQQKRLHNFNRRERVKDPAAAHKQKCRKLGLS